MQTQQVRHLPALDCLQSLVGIVSLGSLPPTSVTMGSAARYWSTCLSPPTQDR